MKKVMVLIPLIILLISSTCFAETYRGIVDMYHLSNNYFDRSSDDPDEDTIYTTFDLTNPDWNTKITCYIRGKRKKVIDGIEMVTHSYRIGKPYDFTGILRYNKKLDKYVFEVKKIDSLSDIDEARYMVKINPNWRETLEELEQEEYNDELMEEAEANQK